MQIEYLFPRFCIFESHRLNLMGDFTNISVTCHKDFLNSWDGTAWIMISCNMRCIGFTVMVRLRIDSMETGQAGSPMNTSRRSLRCLIFILSILELTLLNIPLYQPMQFILWFSHAKHSVSGTKSVVWLILFSEIV